MDKLISVEYALTTLGNDMNIYMNLLNVFYNQYNDVASEIKTLYKNKNYIEIQKIAHKIKGISLNIGSFVLQSKSEFIQKNLFSKKEIKDYTKTLNKVLKEINKILN